MTTLYRVTTKELNFMGAAGPYGVAILALADWQPIPPTAQRFSATVDSWDGTNQTQYFLPTTPFMVFRNPATTAATIAMVSLQTALVPIPMGMNEYNVVGLIADPIAFPFWTYIAWEMSR